MRFKETVTVYNCVETDFKKMLRPKLLRGVHREVQHGSESAADGDKNADSLLVIIPFKGNSKGFLKPLDYALAAEKKGLWTIAAGDLIAIGDTGAAESFAELTTRAEVFRIISVKYFDFGGIPHWEVTAR